MIFSALSSPVTRLSITAICTVVVSIVSFGQADDIASFASADATTSPLSELLCASVGFNRRSINPTCHSIRPTARGEHNRQYPRDPYVSIPVMEPGIKTNDSRNRAASSKLLRVTLGERRRTEDTHPGWQQSHAKHPKLNTRKILGWHSWLHYFVAYYHCVFAAALGESMSTPRASLSATRPGRRSPSFILRKNPVGAQRPSC
jgi:hypothetical protein